MWNEKCARAEDLRGRIHEEGFTRKEEGVRRKEKCESARNCEEGMRGMWKVECGMRNVKARRIYEEGFTRKEEGVRRKEKCESAREARERKERGHFKLKCPLSF